MSNTIKLKNYVNNQFEALANAAITPGNLVEVMSTGKIRKHATEAGNAVPMFAIEDALQGKAITEAYAQNDVVRVWVPLRGDEVYALLKQSENVVIGDLLVSKGDGTLKKHVPESSDITAVTNVTVKPLQIVAVALEALNPTTADGRIKVRIV
jgi:uncharacterized protein with PhoU and TrkA domain